MTKSIIHGSEEFYDELDTFYFVILAEDEHETERNCYLRRYQIEQRFKNIDDVDSDSETESPDSIKSFIEYYIDHWDQEKLGKVWFVKTNNIKNYDESTYNFPKKKIGKTVECSYTGIYCKIN